MSRIIDQTCVCIFELKMQNSSRCIWCIWMTSTLIAYNRKPKSISGIPTLNSLRQIELMQCCECYTISGMTTLNSFSNIATYLPPRCNHKKQQPLDPSQPRTCEHPASHRGDSQFWCAAPTKHFMIQTWWIGWRKKKKNTNRRCVGVRLEAATTITDREETARAALRALAPVTPSS